MFEKRTVAFLDILGFKDYLNNRTLQRLSEDYKRIINMVEAFNRDFLPSNSNEPRLFPPIEHNAKWCIKRIFSDAIILVANDSSEESCLRLLVYVWRIMQASLSFQMPIRGGIAYDEMFVDEKKEIFIGKSLTKAYELEASQQWIGISIHEDVSENYKSFFADEPNNILKNIFLKYSVPFKGGARKKLHTINWRFNFVVQEGTRSLMPRSASHDVIEKVKNTLEYAKIVVDSEELYFNSEVSAPVELRLFSCGDREPPFPHGDDL